MQVTGAERVSIRSPITGRWAYLSTTEIDVMGTVTGVWRVSVPLSAKEQSRAPEHLPIGVGSLPIDVPRCPLFRAPDCVAEANLAPLFPRVIEHCAQLVWRDGGPQWRLVFNHG